MIPKSALLITTLLFFTSCTRVNDPRENPKQPVNLWQVYNDSLKKAKYVDLTHTITPTIPVWKGFGR